MNLQSMKYPIDKRFDFEILKNKNSKLKNLTDYDSTIFEFYICQINNVYSIVNVASSNKNI